MDYSPYKQAWRRRWAREAEADREAAARARAVAARLANVLRVRHGARRVVLVGSLARGEFKATSDIDLGVEGIPDDTFFRVDAELQRLADGFAIDLVPLESADARFREDVDREGVELA